MSKPTYAQSLALGVMTGTSCDGADLALVSKDGTFKKGASVAFPPSLRRRLREAQHGQYDIRKTALLTRDFSRWIGSCCDKKLRDWKSPRHRIFIAVHGQTVWHEPDEAISVQLLDPAVLVAATNCTVVCAFRQPDLARGGQGAPLAPYYHWLRASSSPRFKKRVPMAIHNIGGIANLTYIARNARDVIAFDTGPGNALIDLATEKITRGRKKFDKDGKIAAAAFDEIDWQTIERLAQNPYFRKDPPKSTGRELFNERFLAKLSGKGAALVANATALTAYTMARAYTDFIFKKRKPLRAIFLAGGGAANPTLVSLFSNQLARMSSLKVPIDILPDEYAPPRFLEAIAFAELGRLALRGEAISLQSVTGALRPAVGSGIFPGANYKQLLKLTNVI